MTGQMIYLSVLYNVYSIQREKKFKLLLNKVGY